MWHEEAIRVIFCVVGLVLCAIYGLKAMENLGLTPKDFLNRYYLSVSIAQSVFLVAWLVELSTECHSLLPCRGQL